DEETAEKDACKMEHAISPITLDRLTIFMELIENCDKCFDGNEESSSRYHKQGVLSIRCLEQMRNLSKITEKKSNM
ncbi:MAG: hypothetical protein KJN62_02685, partial [Deltaproteobacteria bacterium]|nr:hypothetical protein [Deltaproteobacteria bacterium]